MSEPPVTLPPIVRRLFSPAGFLLVLGCFLLPFLTVSCEAKHHPMGDLRRSYTITGTDLLVGGEPEVSTTAKRDPERAEYREAAEPIDAEPLAWVAFAFALLGVAGGLLPWRIARHTTVASLALMSAIFLVGAQISVRGQVDPRLRKIIGDAGPDSGITAQVDTRYGFWLAVSLLGLLAVGGLVGLFRTGPAAARTGSGDATDTVALPVVPPDAPGGAVGGRTTPPP